MKKIMTALLIVLAIAGTAFAAYPEKPVEIIVPFQPGGGTDTLGRTIGRYTEKYFGQNFVVVNRPGASGIIGWTSAARTAKPDGYTLTVISPPAFLMHPIQRPETKYKFEDFDIVACIVMDPGIIGVLPGSKFKSLKEIMTALKDKPGSVSIGYSGPGTGEARLLARLEQHAGAKFNKIPFDGSAPSMVALMGKHVDAVMMNISEAHTYVGDSNLRIVGVGSSERDPSMPNVPTFKEQDYDYIQVTVRGLAAPKGLRKDVLQKLESAIKQAYNDPEFQQKAAGLQIPLHYMGSDEFTKFLHKMNEDLKKEWAENPW